MYTGVHLDVSRKNLSKLVVFNNTGVVTMAMEVLHNSCIMLHGQPISNPHQHKGLVCCTSAFMLVLVRYINMLDICHKSILRLVL